MYSVVVVLDTNSCDNISRICGGHMIVLGPATCDDETIVQVCIGQIRFCRVLSRLLVLFLFACGCFCCVVCCVLLRCSVACEMAQEWLDGMVPAGMRDGTRAVGKATMWISGRSYPAFCSEWPLAT